MDKDIAELHCVITGRVQGVTFRNFAKSVAVDLGLIGFVTNLPDGSVEVLAQGNFGILKVFENHLSTGPTGSQVKTIYDEWREPTATFDSFKII